MPWANLLHQSCTCAPGKLRDRSETSLLLSRAKILEQALPEPLTGIGSSLWVLGLDMSLTLPACPSVTQVGRTAALLVGGLGGSEQCAAQSPALEGCAERTDGQTKVTYQISRR